MSAELVNSLIGVVFGLMVAGIASTLLHRGSSNGSNSKPALTPAQRQMYAAEVDENFRWICRVVATRSPYTLTEGDLLKDDGLHEELDDLGQFGEMAHGAVDPSFIWRHAKELTSSPEYPLYGYDAIAESQLVSVFIGTCAREQGIVAYLPRTKQLIVAFSGTSGPAQAFQDCNMRKVRHPVAGYVHAGFWALYTGVRELALDALRTGLQQHGDLQELVFTGHSMGGVMAYLLALDILSSFKKKCDLFAVPEALPMKLSIYGTPRFGNRTLVAKWRTLIAWYRSVNGESAFIEWSVKGYNDGVPSLPPTSWGYAHAATHPFHLYQGKLFKIPENQIEHTVFTVEVRPEAVESQAPSVLHPLGGHNYYHRRDMERTNRKIKWLDLANCGENGWAERLRLKEKEFSTR